MDKFLSFYTLEESEKNIVLSILSPGDNHKQTLGICLPGDTLPPFSTFLFTFGSCLMQYFKHTRQIILVTSTILFVFDETVAFTAFGITKRGKHLIHDKCNNFIF